MYELVLARRRDGRQTGVVPRCGAPWRQLEGKHGRAPRGGSKARPRPRHRTAASTEARKNINIRHRAFCGMGTAPLGRGWSVAVPGDRYEGDRPALEQQIGDVRAGRDVRRGFVNARRTLAFRTRRPTGQPATAAGQTGPRWAATRRRATRRKPATRDERPGAYGEDDAPGRCPGPATAFQLPCRGRVRVPPGRHRLDEPAIVSRGQARRVPSKS